MHRTTALRRPAPAPRPGRLARLRTWLVEDLGGTTTADRALVAALLRLGPPH